MGILTLVCKQCGGQVGLDDTKEFGFCNHCGTKILITNDVVQNTFNTVHNTTQNITKHVYGGEAGKDAEEMVNDGLRLFKIGQIEKAVNSFEKAVDVDPMNWRAWLYMGDLYTGTKAVESYESALRILEEVGEDADFDMVYDSIRSRDDDLEIVKFYLKEFPDDWRIRLNANYDYSGAMAAAKRSGEQDEIRKIVFEENSLSLTQAYAAVFDDWQAELLACKIYSSLPDDKKYYPGNSYYNSNPDTTGRVVKAGIIVIKKGNPQETAEFLQAATDITVKHDKPVKNYDGSMSYPHIKKKLSAKDIQKGLKIGEAIKEKIDKGKMTWEKGEKELRVSLNKLWE